MSHRKPEPPPRVLSGRWKSTVREFLTAVVAFLPVAVLVGRELELDKTTELAGVFGVLAALSTALSSPAGRAWMFRYLHDGTDTTTPADTPDPDSRPKGRQPD